MLSVFVLAGTLPVTSCLLAPGESVALGILAGKHAVVGPITFVTPRRTPVVGFGTPALVITVLGVGYLR